MKKGIVAVYVDRTKIETLFEENMKQELIWCMWLEEVEKLQGAEEVYFAISKTAMCSTQLQMTVAAALPDTKHLPQWLLRLEDDVVIPSGFSGLKALPERDM